MSVLLKPPPFEGITPKELAQQIASKKKCRLKLPTWFKTEGIYYPESLSIEQASSEVTAEYKAELVDGKSLVDITGGFGVDSFFFSQKMENVWHCEINHELSQIATHNFKTLGAKRIESRAINGIDFVLSSQKKFHWLYIDPSRRNENKEKVFLLSDCSPDVPAYLDQLLDKRDHILLKTSPLLDISAGLEELHFVRELHGLAVNNEVKELLWIIDKSSTARIHIKTINISKGERQQFSFYHDSEKEAISQFDNPLKYLYEPNAAIMKAGGFKSVGINYSIKKLHQNTHLFTSDALIPFPGRRFEIIENIPYNKKSIKSLELNKANIATRNFPVTVAEIRKKYKIKEGGDSYMFFITNQSGDFRVLLCKKP
ncbi:MAG: class I SAM-dependent methyltransferase [Flavobacteriaceae bacterium]